MTGVGRIGFAALPRLVVAVAELCVPAEFVPMGVVTIVRAGRAGGTERGAEPDPDRDRAADGVPADRRRLIGRAERWRAGLMLPDGISSPHAKLPAGLTLRARLTFRRREQASMRALGYGFVLGVFLWPLSALFAGISATTLLTTLAAPVIADGDQMGMGPWTLDTAREGLLVPGPVRAGVLRGQLVLARGDRGGAQASLAKVMLGPRRGGAPAEPRRAASFQAGPGRRVRDRAGADRAAPARRRTAAAGRTHHDARSRRAGPARKVRASVWWSRRMARPRRRWRICGTLSEAFIRGCWWITGWRPPYGKWPIGCRCR